MSMETEELEALGKNYPSLPDVLWEVQCHRLPNLRLKGSHIFVLPYGFVFYHGPVGEHIASRMTYIPAHKVERMHQVGE